MKRLLIGACTLCIAVAACKKDDTTQNTLTTHTREETLSTGKWLMTAIIGTGNNPFTSRDTTLDVYASFDSCAKDDLYLFLTSGKVMNDQGTIKCDTSGPQQIDGGTWSLNAAKDTLIMANGTLPGKFRITFFSNDSMKLQSDTSFSIFKLRLFATLKHQ